MLVSSVQRDDDRMILTGRSFEIPDFFRGQGLSCPDAPGTVADIDDAVVIDLAISDGVGAFIGVVVVLKGQSHTVFLKMGHPMFTDAGFDLAIEVAVRGEGGDVVDGDDMGDAAVFAFTQGRLQPVRLLALDGVCVVCVEGDDAEIVGEVEDAVARLAGKGE